MTNEALLMFNLLFPSLDALRCNDGTFLFPCQQDPPPRCLLWTPNPANQRPDCVDVPGEVRPEADPEQMIRDFKKRRYNPIHY